MMPEMRAPLWRNPYVLAVATACVAAALLRPLLRPEPEPLPVLGTLPEFALIDSSGRPFGTTELAGKVWIASFFFTRCPSVCPLIMARMGELQRRLAAAGVADVRLVSITVDPEHDTPEVLRAAEPRYGVDPGRWTLLTGPRERLHELLVAGFHVPGLDAAALADGDIPHTTKLALVDGVGRIRGYYGSDEEGAAEVLRHALRLLATPRGRDS